MSGRGTRLAGLLALALAAVGAPAAADEPSDAGDGAADFDLSSSAWNGLGTFGSVARSAGLTVKGPDEFRLEELGERDAVLFVHPTRAVEASALTALARRGNAIVVADHVGEAKDALARLGLLRERPGLLEDAERYRDLSFAPIASPTAPGSPLAKDVRGLVTNHPALFTRTGQMSPIFGFPSGETAVAEGRVGRGRIIAISDPSILINRMLELEDNLQFAINLVRELRVAQGAERLVVVTGDARVSGTPPPPDADSHIAQTLARAAHRLDDAADELGEYLITEPAIRAAALAVAAAIAIACVAAPGAPRRAIGQWVAAAPARSPRADLDAIFGRAGDLGRARLSFALPATVVRDNIDRLLAERLCCHAPLSSLSEQDLARRVERELGREAARALARLTPLLAALPARGSAAAPGGPYVSRRGFERLHSAARRFEAAAGAS